MSASDAPRQASATAGSAAAARVDSGGSSATRRSATLFRREVFEHASGSWLGPVLLAPRLSHRVFVALGLASAGAILALLFGAGFTRTAAVGGTLVPQEGIVRVLPPRPGVVTQIHVREGTMVRQGDRLLTLSDELQSAAFGAVQAEVARQMAQRRSSLVDERGHQERLLDQQSRALADRVEAMRAEGHKLEHEVALMRSRVEIARRNEALHRLQLREGYISGMRMQIVESETLEQVARLGAVDRALLVSRREQATAAAELRDLPLKMQKELASIDRSLAQLGQERAETEARREIIVASPGNGTVTAIQAVIGVAAKAGAPLLSVVPAASRLEAHLYGTSRTIGFVRPGQAVRLRYQAYPYQRFGHHDGVVASVSRTAVDPSELPAGTIPVSPNSSSADAAAKEPVYRIVVEPARQDIVAYGESRPLQPGMALDADVALERRRLVEWVLEPLYAVSGKWP